MTGSNTTFIIIAYAVTWVVVLAYFARLVVLGARVRDEFARRGGATAGEQRR